LLDKNTLPHILFSDLLNYLSGLHRVSFYFKEWYTKISAFYVIRFLSEEKLIDKCTHKLLNRYLYFFNKN